MVLVADGERRIRIQRMHSNRSEPNDVPTRPAIIEKELSFAIVGAFYEVYNELGFGFLESVYSKALEVALSKRGVRVEREVPIVIRFQGVEVGHHRADMLVERRVILEIKSTERISDATRRQVRNYLAAMRLELGIILHFGPSAQFYRILGPRPAPTRSDSANSD